MEILTDREREWRELYVGLGNVLGQYGKSDAFGNGDFWLVDDDWGERQHKVCISRLNFLTPTMAREVQEILKRMASEWEVWFQLELDSDVGPEGIIVRPIEIEECWNREELAKKFGSEFCW